MKNRKRHAKELLVLIPAVLLGGCFKGAGNDPAATPEPVPTPAAAETESPERPDSWTAYVSCTYEMRFKNDSEAEYNMTGLIEVDEINETAHLSQTFYADGIESSLLSGWYDAGKLYITYNGVDYYDEMSLKDVKDLMLVPMSAAEIREKDILKAVPAGEDGVTYILTDDASKSWFTGHYDFYDIGASPGLKMNKGQIRQKTEGVYLTEEEAEFEAQAQIGGMDAVVTYHSSMLVRNINETEVVINDQVREMLAAYPHYSEIDTSQIAEGDTERPGETVIETLQNRLVSRLGYTVQDDGTYLTEYNEGESYRFDFANSLFTYSNRTSTYVYSWKGDTGGFGTSCNYDFASKQGGSGCTQEVIEMIEKVRLFFEMELYYCSLSAEDLAGTPGGY